MFENPLWNYVWDKNNFAKGSWLLSVFILFLFVGFALNKCFKLSFQAAVVLYHTTKKKKKIMGGLSLRELFFSERVISLWNFEPLGPLSEHYVWKAKIIEQGWQRRLPLGTRENGVSGLSLKTTKYPKKIKEKGHADRSPLTGRIFLKMTAP